MLSVQSQSFKFTLRFLVCVMILAVVPLKIAVAMPAPTATRSIEVPQLGELATLAAIQQAITLVTQQLSNLGVALGGEAQSVVGQASQELNFRLQQLQALVRDNINAPIASLGLDVQELARQIRSSLERLDAIINGQRQCLNQNAEILLSSVANIIQDLKRGVPLLGTTTQLSYFQFEGAPARSVPISGGRLTIFGSKLWPRADLPPTVALQSTDRRTNLQTLTPQRATSDNNVSTVIDGSSIREHTGECLQLRVVARDKTGIWPFRRTVETELYLPVCISQSYKTEFSVEAGLVYDSTETVTQVLGAKEFRQDNSSCESRQSINIQNLWDLPSGNGIANPSIVSISERTGDFQRHTSNATAAIVSANSVIVRGWIDTADCICVPIAGCRLNSTTIFQRFVTPTVQYQKTSSTPSSAPAVRVSMTFPATQVRLLLPKTSVSPNTTFWFRLTRLVNGVNVAQFESSRVTVNANGGTTPMGNMGDLQIQGRLNPTPVNGNAELLVTVTAPPCSQ